VPFLSPAKLLVILVVALIVLGPDKLPKVARQIGSLWGDFRLFRERLESEVRGTFPDLPSTETITQAVRSPLSLPRHLADSHSAENGDHIEERWAPATNPRRGGGCGAAIGSESNRPAGSVQAVEETPGIPGVIIVDPGGIVHQVRSSAGPSPTIPG
jgi:TatA/E family protein of Tat protein translocase